MRDISIGIYHKDYQYGKRLMEYLNHQKDFPMTASFISDEDAFFRQEEEGDFECLVLAEETDYHGSSPVCRIGVNDSMGGMYCQSGKEIAAGIYHCLNVSPQLDDERIWGLFTRSKIGSIRLCKRNGGDEWMDLFWNAAIWTFRR